MLDQITINKFIAGDVKAKLGGQTVGVVFPILSRNRFAICLRGIAKGAKKIVLMLSYPSDEVGNHLVSLDALDERGVDPYKDVLSLEKYRELFGYEKHPFTGVDYTEGILDEGEELSLVVGSESLVLFGDGMESDRLTLTWGQSVRVSRAPRALALVDPAGLGEE